MDIEIKKEFEEEIEEEFKEKKSNIKKIVIITLCILIGIFLLIVYARYKATSGIKVYEYKITEETLPSSFHGTKIVQFSDIYYGNTVDIKYLKKIINKINELNPDIVIFTGDLTNNNIDEETTNNIISTLSNINSKIGKYAIKGDIDNESFDKIIPSSGFTTLDNTSTNVYYNKNEFITLSNIDNNIENFSIYLLHKPDDIENLSNKFNVILAGHSLGGQINLPIIKKILLPNGAKKYYNKYYKDKNMYISSGIGTTSFKYRFLNKPSINLYRLTKH